MKKIRILIVDDHFVVRMGLVRSIEMERDMEVVGEAGTSQEAIDQFTRHRPDITLMDLRLPAIGGIETTRQICKRFPDARIIILSAYELEEDVYQAVRAGARSYLFKSVLRPDLLRTIRMVHAGQYELSPAAAARLAERVAHPEMSERELAVLKALARGGSNKEIAAELSVTEFTVKFHVRGIMAKLGVPDRAQVITAAIRRGIIRLPEG